MSVIAVCVVSRGEGETTRWQRLSDALSDVPMIDTAMATFVQCKTTPLLREPIESRGTVRLAQGVLRFDTHEPYETVMLIAEGKVTLYDPAARSAERFTIADTMPGLSTGLRFDPEAMRRDWQLVSFNLDQPAATMILRLRDHDDQQSAALTVTLDRRTGFAQQVTLPSSPGETTQLLFSDVQVNVPMTPESLLLQLPEDVKVTELDASGAGR
jgi:outer membrane lipoprotein-sorting protein